MLVKVCAWCLCVMRGTQAGSVEVTEAFKQMVLNNGDKFTHGCCVGCLDEMDTKLPVHWNVPTEITSSMTADHPSGLYYSQPGACANCAELPCRCGEDEPEMPSPCQGCASEETSRDCAMCPESPEHKEFPWERTTPERGLEPVDPFDRVD